MTWGITAEAVRTARRAAEGSGAFIGARALQGAANAFLSPLLAAVAASSPPCTVGRAAGTFAAVQTTALVGAGGCAPAMPFLGFAASPAALAAGSLSAGIGSACVWAGINTMAVEAVPPNARARGRSCAEK